MIALPVIPSTSPSLAETMRACMLRAGLSRCAQLQPLVLGNPKAWLGTAYHKVLVELPAILASGASVVTQAEEVWNTEIARLEQEAALHPLNARFGPAPSWKGYFLVQATLWLRIEEALAASPHSQATPTHIHPPVREEEITAAHGKLRGKTDLLCGDDLIDYKTGSIFEEDESEGTAIVKPAYVRQLRIYAWLVHESAGRWVKRGLLYPLAGPPVELAIQPAECEHEAEEAIELLDSYNAAIAAQSNPAAMAAPSPETCCWCPYKPLCPAFWGAVNPDWSGRLDGEAIRGNVGAPQPLLATGAGSLIVDVVSGTQLAGRSVRLAPLPVNVHPALTGLDTGQEIVLVRIGKRANNSLFPLLQTVVLRTDQLPQVC